MKKFYQIVASIALSSLGLAATAQQAASLNGVIYRSSQAHSAPAVRGATNANRTARVLNAPNNVFLDYYDGDKKNNAPSLNFFYWNPGIHINAGYILRDTTFSPYTSGNANAELTQYATVVFDTMWDTYSQQYYNPIISPLASQPTVLDTIWGYFTYHNTTGTNDTAIFEVDSVDAGGFPTATSWGRDTVVFNNGNPLRLNKLDSVQFAGFVVPRGGITIPKTARHRWNFALQMTVHGSKLDTLGLWYFSAGKSCTGFGICNAYTAVGVKDGRAPAVNSFTFGNAWYNDTKNHGNGRPVMWPNIPPASASNYPGMCANTGGYYYCDQVFAGCSAGDTCYYYVQDIGLEASLHFTDVTGMEELNDNGFSVNQNAPNPFNQNTLIAFNLAKESNVVFSVYDMTGRELLHNSFSTLAPGRHSVELAANEFTPGVYLYTFDVNGVRVTKRMVITQ